MITTEQFLDLCAAKLGSDYKTSKALGKGPSYVAKIRCCNGVLSDEVGLEVAALLDFPIDTMILCLAAERALKKGSFHGVERLAAAAESHIPADFQANIPPPLKTGT